MNYLKAQLRAAKSIAKNGKKFALWRGGGVENVGGIEVETPEVSLAITGIVVQYKLNEIDGTLIESGDFQIIATAETEIKIDDWIDVDGRRYRVISPNPIKPAGVLILYKPQLRA